MAWGRREWKDYGGRHIAPAGMTVKELIEATKSGFGARYYQGVDVRQLEMRATLFAFDQDETGKAVLDDNGNRQFHLIHGRCLFPNNNFSQIYLISDNEIGVSNGERTHITLVQWDEEPTCDVHGHPISKSDLERKLRKKNPQELIVFQQECKRRGLK